MNYQRYFKPDQQLLLKACHEEDSCTELMSAFVVSVEEGILVLSLPYGADAVDQYPFKEGLLVEVTTEAMGLCVRTTGHFKKKIDGNQFSLQLNPELKMFQRRITQRFDCKLGIRFSREGETLQAMREIWEKNIEVLHSPEAPLIFSGFKSCQVNLSSGGIRFLIKPPCNQGDLGLVLINLDDGKPPVCAVTEVVWTFMKEKSAISAGMRFINILSEDQQRIDHFIAKFKNN